MALQHQAYCDSTTAWCIAPANPRTLRSPSVTYLPERRLLSSWIHEARKHGQRPHQVKSWIRRKAGGTVCVWRHLTDGSLGCSVPCVCCRKLLTDHHLAVTCVVSAQGEWWTGRLDEPGAPASKPTSRQQRDLKFKG